jgi:hypothetical protein
MLKQIAFAAAVLLLAAAPAPAAREPDHSTLFQHCEQAWGVGTIDLTKAMTYRDGKLLVYPGQFTDLVWAPNGTKPRNMMIVVEAWPDDDPAKPFLDDSQDIFAPVIVLPENSYWKDNLPFTKRHQIPGGRRYIFRGDQIPEVRKIVETYMKAHETPGAQRLKEKVVAVAAALQSTIVYVREDAVTWFAEHPALARDFDDRALPSIKAYLSGNAPAEEKAKLIETLSAAKIESVKPLLQQQANTADASGAAALRALEATGEKETTDALLEKSRSSSVDVQAYALEVLGARAATEDAAFARCKEITDPVTSPSPLVGACIEGLGQAGGDRVRGLLVALVERGDTGSRQAAIALAATNDPAAIGELQRILEKSKGEPAIAAAGGLSQAPNCASCTKTLEVAHHDHPDEMVRNLAGMLLGVPMVHKH